MQNRLPSVVLLSLLTLALGRVAYRQEPLKVDSQEAWEHGVGPVSLIHSKAKLVYPQRDYVTLQVIVDEHGAVESARAVDGPEEFFGAAESIETKRKFKPFERDGVAVEASLSDTVSIVPPEQWAKTDIPFPELKDWNSLRMRLKRTTCYGSCPAYSVRVAGDGEVEFDGERNVLITGHHTARINKLAVENLLGSFRRANYFSLNDKYVTTITDSPTYTTSIECDGKTKSVRDYVGLRAGMPEVVQDLEDAFDQISGTGKWLKENEETGAALLAEKWDFKADTEENRALFSNVVAHGSAELIRLFIEHGASALRMTNDGQSALINAAGKGNLDLVKLLIGSKTQAPAEHLSCALGAAAASGNLALVRFLLENGSDPNGPPCGKYQKLTVLMKAARSGKADLVEEILKYRPSVNAKDSEGATALAFSLERSSTASQTQTIMGLLIEAGADVNSRDNNQQTPIFYACSAQKPEAIRALVKAGADVNARDASGQTVLMYCFGNASLAAVIEAGADLTVRNQFGLTAAETARQIGMNDKAELLEIAAKQHGQK